MSDKPGNRKRILFVDDELAFLEMIEGLFTLWSKNEWEIHLAHNTGKALAIIQQHPIDLIVVDMRMPVVDGLQFLRLLHRKYPNIPKAALTGSDDERYQTECLNNGAELFLRKPANIEGMESVYANLNELIKMQPQEGFRGVLRRVGLQEVLQLECLGRKSSVLEVAGEGMRGLIYIHDGSIIHAQVGDHKGEMAFYKIFSLDGGEFTLKPFEEPPEKTIEGSWEFLVMEAARVRDEVGDPTAGQPVQEESVPEKPRSAPKAAAKPAAKAAKPAPPPKPAPSPTLQPQVEEMLICSTKGDVLYQWQCTESDLRTEWVNFITAKAKEITHETNLGGFDRLEVIGSKTRMVTQVSKDWSVLVRSSNSMNESMS
jgi:CheY-like chemotaxis protein